MFYYINCRINVKVNIDYNIFRKSTSISTPATPFRCSNWDRCTMTTIYWTFDCRWTRSARWTLTLEILKICICLWSTRMEVNGIEFKLFWNKCFNIVHNWRLHKSLGGNENGILPVYHLHYDLVLATSSSAAAIPSVDWVHAFVFGWRAFTAKS